MKYLIFLVLLAFSLGSCTQESEKLSVMVDSEQQTTDKKFPLYDGIDASNHILVHSSYVLGDLAGVSIKGRFSLNMDHLQEVDLFQINGSDITPDGYNRYLKSLSNTEVDDWYSGKDVGIKLNDGGKNLVDEKVYNHHPVKASFNQNLRQISRKKPLIVNWSGARSNGSKIGVYIAHRGIVDNDDENSLSKVYHVDYFDDNGVYEVPLELLNKYAVNSKVDILFGRGTYVPVGGEGDKFELGINVVSTDLYPILIVE